MNAFSAICPNITESLRSGLRWLWTLLALSTILGLSQMAQAKDFYVAQYATGNGSGSDAADCQSAAWFNTITSWTNGTGTIQPGDTIHLTGTITTALTVGASGAAGNPITIYFEPDARMSAPYWAWTSPTAGAINVFGKNYIVIDGGSNGVIEATQCGSALANQSGSVGVAAISPCNFTVKNLTVRDMYVRTSNADESGGYGNQQGTGIQIFPTAGPQHDLLITNCTLYDEGNGIQVFYGVGSSNYTFVANTMYRVNWGGNCGNQTSSATLQNLYVAHNHIFNFTNWNDPGNNYFHHNGWYFWAQSGAIATNLIFDGNIIGPDFGNGYCTSGLWTDQAVYGVVFRNNLVICNSGDGTANAMLMSSCGQFLNNTLLGGGVGAGITSGSNSVVMGNIITGCTAFMNNYDALLSNWYPGKLVMDSNIVYNLKSGENYSFGSGGTSWFISYDYIKTNVSGWSGIEAHMPLTNPLVNADGTLQSNSPAIGAGPNFSGLFTTDIAGNPRPASGVWTAGAFQTVASQLEETAAVSVTPPNQVFGSIDVGATADQSFTVKNSGGGVLTGSASVASPFTIVSGGYYSLTTGQIQTVTVRYSPTAPGTNTATVTFSNNGSAEATATLIGTAVPALTLAAPTVSAIIQSGADVDTNATGLQIFAGSVVQYSASATDTNGFPLAWQWSYTVNGGPATMVQSGTGGVSSVSFNYTPDMVGDSYVWTLTANNGYSTASSSLTVGVEAPPPPSAGLTFQATNAVLTAPFVLANGSISQAVQTTDPTLGGQAVFTFSVAKAGAYVLQALVNAPNDANNSFFVNVDAQPSAPAMIWDIPITSGFEQRIVSWRGNGTDTSNQFVPAVFNLSAGVHQLIIRGREGNVQLQSVAILSYVSPPQQLHVVAGLP